MKIGDNVTIGDNTTISFNCDIFSANKVSIGENVQVAAYTFLNGGSHKFDRIDIPIIKQDRNSVGIAVEDNVWLGANAKILDGVTIGRDSIVGAGAVVNDSVEPFTIVAGVPAKLIRKR